MWQNMLSGAQPDSQPQVGKRGPFPHAFLYYFLPVFLNFHSFLPQFSPPGGRLAHPRRPWLRHCMLPSCKQNTGKDTLFMHHTDRVQCSNFEWTAYVDFEFLIYQVTNSKSSEASTVQVYFTVTLFCKLKIIAIF